MGCPAPAGLSGSLPSGPEAAKAKLLRMGVSSLLRVTVSGLCSPMLPNLPSSGILLEKPLSTDACAQSISLQFILARGLHVCVCKFQKDLFAKHLGWSKPALLRAWLLEKLLLIHALLAVTHFYALHTIQLDALARQLKFIAHPGRVGIDT